MLLFSAYGVAYYFTGNGIDEATIYHLKYGLGGAGFLEYIWLIATTITVLVLGTIYLLWFILKSTKDRASRTLSSRPSYALLSISILLNPAIIDTYNLQEHSSMPTKIPAIIDIYNLQEHSSMPTNFYDFYRKPHITPSGDNQKNIVFIYAEGLERTFFDKTLFPGLIKGLRKLESTSTYFTNIKQVRRTGWTIGGIVASQCGLPLFTPSHGNSMSSMDQFLSSAVCLGDLLNHQGYHLTYMGGGSLDFAGKGKLFKTHGFTDVLGQKELLPKIKNRAYKTSWGLYDDSLIKLIYRRFMESSAAGEKFGLFTLTLDTHHPTGHPSRSCRNIKYKDGSNPFLNAVACSDYLITILINKIIQSPFADQTVIVLVSDHLAMRNTASDLLKKKDRRNLFMIIDPGVNRPWKIQTIGSTLDIGTTVLPFIGYKGNIGLGRNLLIGTGQGEAERIFIHDNLVKWKTPIMGFWDFPKIQDSLKIYIDGKFLRIDNRNFRIPILIELNANLESTLFFQVHQSPQHKTLVQHRNSLNENKYFLLIDECKNSRVFDRTLGKKGFCLVAGKGKTNTKIMKLQENIAYTANEIRQLLDLANDFKAYRVAHAGGGVNNKTYTNSLEALDHNIKKGFHYFELDFSFTKDDRLVCLHDWKKSFERSFGVETAGKVTLKEFNLLVKNKSEFKKCTVDSLAEWMKNNPSAYIVTDVKENNPKALKIILKTLPNAKMRVIPQVYNPDNFLKIQDMGFEQVIWTLYRYSGSNNKVLNWAKRFHGAFAITMPENRAAATLPADLRKLHIPTYVHTINSPQKSEIFSTHYKITEIYTDFLQP